MANDKNGTFAFPQLDLRGTVSPDLYAPRRGPDVPDALGQLAGDADQVGHTLQTLAEQAARREGADQAALDTAAGRVQPRNDDSARGEGYDAVAKNFLASQRQAQLAEQMQAAYEANPRSPVQLGQAMDALHKGLGRTGYSDLDAALDGHFLVRRADFMARAIAGARQQTIEQDKANFLTDLQTGQSLLDQVAAGASMDDKGGQRLLGAGQLFLKDLSKYGPKEAFDVAGIHFDADPSRRAALGADDIARVGVKALGQAQKTWILTTAQQLSDEGSRKMFAQQVLDKWKAGDKAFAWLDGQDMEQLQAHLEASADRARADANAAKVEYERNARGAIEAFTWGQDVDFDEALTNARLSGNPALVAQVQFFKDADPQTRGVLRSVVARQMGLMNTGPGEVVVDGAGNPIQRGVRNNNPGNLKAVQGVTYPGQTGVDEAGYAVFATPQAGVFQAKKQLDLYGQRGLNTVQDIVKAWAPAADHNDPAAYAKTVADKLHVTPTTQLNMKDPAVVDHLAEAMFGVETPQAAGAWGTPATVKPGTPAYVAWASTREGFTTDPLTYSRGGANRPPIANVPVLVPQGAFSADAGEHQAWSQAFAQRLALGQSLANTYGVPPRTLTNGERDFYKAQIQADPFKGITLAQAAQRAGGAEAAMRLMRELGENDFQASATLHIADLAAGGKLDFARRAAQGLQLQADGKTKLPDLQRQNLARAFETWRGAVPTPVWTSARTVAEAAMLQDHLSGNDYDANAYVDEALGGNSLNGRHYGGVDSVNGARTVLPRWLATGRAQDALETLGDMWRAKGLGPMWANGQQLTGHELAGMRLTLQPSGRYRFVNPRTGNPLMARGGKPFEIDLDPTRAYLAQHGGPDLVKPAGF